VNALTIAIALQEAKQQLLSSSDTAELDAEVLLAHALQVARSYLFAYPERVLTSDEIIIFQEYLEQRKIKTPIAYITGHQEFWSLDFIVTSDTLIPRADTELLVELVLQFHAADKDKKISIVDLGTGSGAIALALAHECPHWEVHATDWSVNALEIAKQNAKRLHLSQVIFHQGSWCKALPSEKKFDVIVSNPPYIASDDPDLQCGILKYEPASAIISSLNGLQDVLDIITQAKRYLKPQGKLLIEHGFQQGAEIRRIFSNLGYSNINTYQDLAGLDRVTVGTY